MKISCDSCGAKYTIADAKVQGRKVKVRCKSCKATILVDGNSSGDASDDTALSVPPEAAPAALAAAGPGGGTPKPGSVKKDGWSVNLSDDDSRDMTTAEIIAGWKSGLVTQDAYAWKDGMADWKPILEIPELKQKLLASRPLKPEPVISSAKLPPSPGRPGGSTDDLFGGVDLAGSETEAAASPGRPAPKAAAGTGARNESSVLFSLDSLTGGGAAAPMAASPDIFGGLGGGGLLANNTDLLTAPAKEPPPAPVFKVPSVRPAMPGQQKSSMPLILGIVAALLVVGGVLFFVMGGKDEPSADPAAAAMAAELEKTKAELEKTKAEDEAAKKKAEEAAKKAAEEAAKPVAAADPGKKPEDKPAESAAPATTPSPSTSTNPSTPSSGTPSAGTTPKPAAPSGGGAFDVGAAKAALAGAAAGAAGCGSAGGPKGSGKVQVTFAPSGRVTSANVVAGPFGGTSVGGCVASKFRAARVPAFNGSPQTVSKSFTVN